MFEGHDLKYRKYIWFERMYKIKGKSGFTLRPLRQ